MPMIGLRKRLNLDGGQHMEWLSKNVLLYLEVVSQDYLVDRCK